MKNKLKFLIGMSLNRKIKTKWFVLANIFLAILIIGVANIDHIITFFGGDFDKTTKIYVIDNTNTYDVFKASIDAGFKLTEDSKYEIIKYDNSKEEITETIKTNEEEKDSIALVFNYDEENIVKVEMITNGFVDTLNMSLINSAVNSVKTYLAVEKFEISEEELLALNTPVTIERTVLDEEKDSTEENMEMIMSAVVPVIILPFFMLVIFLVQMIGAEVNDEKTTRGMEIIIGNVSPQIHFFSKCIAGNLFILIQGGLLLLFGILGFISRSFFGDVSGIGDVFNQVTGMMNNLFTPSFIESLRYIIPLVLILMILTFIGYSLLAGILASMTTNTEDFQQLQTPIMLISLLGYYLAIIAGGFKGSLIINILGYVPFISAILSPSLLVMGEFTVIDVLISIGLMIVVIFLLIRYGLKIYKVGILNYSSDKLWRKMFKALKN